MIEKFMRTIAEEFTSINETLAPRGYEPENLIYCSIDIETTGLDRKKHQILEIGAILKELGGPKLEKFHCYVDHKEFTGTPYALYLNSNIFEIIDKGEDPRILEPGDASYAFRSWLLKCKDKYGRIYPAGKNYATMDREFLHQLGVSRDLLMHRTIDPGPMFISLDDPDVPHLASCLEKAGMESEVTHNALDDAQQVIDLIEYFVAKKKDTNFD